MKYQEYEVMTPVSNKNVLNCEIKDFIGVYPDLYSQEYCRSAIQNFETLMSSGFGYKHDWGTNRSDKVIFSGSAHTRLSAPNLYNHFLEVFWKLAYEQYRAKYPSLDTGDVHTIYECKIQKTEVGEGFHQWHFDSQTRATLSRMLVFILYLNDVDEGGETEFLHLSRRVQPKAGTLLIFPAGFTHTHRGNTPISNSKYILTGWIEK